MGARRLRVADGHVGAICVALQQRRHARDEPWARPAVEPPADPGRAGGRCSAHESVMPGEAILTPAGVPGSPGSIPSSPCSCAIHRSAPPSRRNLIFDPTASRRVGPRAADRGALNLNGAGPPIARARLVPTLSVVGRLLPPSTNDIHIRSRNTQRSREYFPRPLLGSGPIPLGRGYKVCAPARARPSARKGACRGADEPALRDLEEGPGVLSEVERTGDKERSCSFFTLLGNCPCAR